MTDLRLRLILLQLVLLAFSGITYYLMNEHNRGILISHTILVGFAVTLSFLLPDAMMFGEDDGVYMIVLRSGDRIMMLATGFTVWRLIIDFSVLVYFTVVIILMVRSQFRSPLKETMPIFFGSGLVLVMGLFDQLVDIGSVQSIYLLPYAMFINYMILSYVPLSQLMRDVFKRREILDQEKRWTVLVEEANVIVVVLNRMGHVDYVNPYFYRLTGYDENEVIAKDWFEFFVPQDQYYEVQSAFIEILEFDFHPRFQNSINTKLGKQLIVDWYNVRLRDSSEQVIGSMSIGVEITSETKEMDEIKRRLLEAEALIKILQKDNKD